MKNLFEHSLKNLVDCKILSRFGVFQVDFANSGGNGDRSEVIFKAPGGLTEAEAWVNHLLAVHRLLCESERVSEAAGQAEAEIDSDDDTKTSPAFSGPICGILERRNMSANYPWLCEPRMLRLEEGVLTCHAVCSEGDGDVASGLQWSVPASGTASTRLEVNDDGSGRCFALHVGQHVMIMRAKTKENAEAWLSGLPNEIDRAGSLQGAISLPEVPTSSRSIERNEVKNDVAERALKIQERLMGAFANISPSDIAATTEATGQIIGWLLAVLDVNMVRGQQDDSPTTALTSIEEHVRICHPFISLKLTEFASTDVAGISMNDTLQLMDMLRAYSLFLSSLHCILKRIGGSHAEHLIERFPDSCGQAELRYLCTRYVNDTRPELQSMCKRTWQEFLQSPSNSIREVEQGGEIRSSVPKTIIAIAEQYLLAAGQGADILQARVLQLCASCLLGGYGSYVVDIGADVRDMTFLLACANDCMQLMNAFYDIVEEHGEVLEIYPEAEDAVDKASKNCLRGGRRCVQLLAKLVALDLSFISESIFSAHIWSSGEEVGNMVATIQDYCSEFHSRLAPALHVAMVSHCLSQCVIVYFRAIINAAMVLRVENRLTVRNQNQNAAYLIRDLRLMKAIVEELSSQLLYSNAGLLPMDINMILLIIGAVGRLVTAANVKEAVVSVFQELLSFLREQYKSSPNRRPSVRALAATYCFVSQICLVRDVPDEIVVQSEALGECRLVLERDYKITAEKIQRDESGVFKELPGLAGVMQAICPLCHAQYVRDARGPKKRMSTKLKKKIRLFRPGIADLGAPSTRVSQIPREKARDVGESAARQPETSAKGHAPLPLNPREVSQSQSQSPAHRVDGRTGEEEKLKDLENDGALDAGVLFDELLRDVENENDRKDSKLDMVGLQEELLGDMESLPEYNGGMPAVAPPTKSAPAPPESKMTTPSAFHRAPRRRAPQPLETSTFGTRPPPAKTAPIPTTERTGTSLPPAKPAPAAPADSVVIHDGPPSKNAPLPPGHSIPPAKAAPAAPMDSIATNDGPPVKSAPLPPGHGFPTGNMPPSKPAPLPSGNTTNTASENAPKKNAPLPPRRGNGAVARPVNPDLHSFRQPPHQKNSGKSQSQLEKTVPQRPPRAAPQKHPGAAPQRPPRRNRGGRKTDALTSEDPKPSGRSSLGTPLQPKPAPLPPEEMWSAGDTSDATSLNPTQLSVSTLSFLSKLVPQDSDVQLRQKSSSCQSPRTGMLAASEQANRLRPASRYGRKHTNRLRPASQYGHR